MTVLLKKVYLLLGNAHLLAEVRYVQQKTVHHLRSGLEGQGLGARG